MKIFMNDLKFILVSYYTSTLLIIFTSVFGLLIYGDATLLPFSLFLLIVPAIIFVSYKLVVSIYNKIERFLTG